MKIVQDKELEPISQLYHCPQDEEEYYINYGEFIQNMPYTPKVKELLKQRESYLSKWQNEDGSSFFVPLTVANDEVCWAITQINSMSTNLIGNALKKEDTKDGQ